MTRSTFEANYAARAKKVKAGVLNVSSLTNLLRDRIMRLEENTRPLAGYAPHCMHDANVRELAERKTQLSNLRATLAA